MRAVENARRYTWPCGGASDLRRRASSRPRRGAGARERIPFFPPSPPRAAWWRSGTSRWCNSLPKSGGKRPSFPIGVDIPCAVGIRAFAAPTQARPFPRHGVSLRPEGKGVSMNSKPRSRCVSPSG